MMKAPKEIRCRVVPKVKRIGNETEMVKIKPKPMINPLRKPIVKIKAMITIKTDSTKFTMKELIAVVTLSGWKKIFSVYIPAGTRCIVSANFASTNSPTSGTIASACIAKQIAIAGLPFTKKPYVCGSA